jgi:hypothetical protein
MLVYLVILFWLLADRSVNIIKQCFEQDEAHGCQMAHDNFIIDLSLIYWTFMGSKFIQLTQIYEWVSMKLIIEWQSKRDFTMAMLDAEDPQARKDFSRMEIKR